MKPFHSNILGGFEKCKAGVLATFCCALWGSAFPVVKLGYMLLNIETAESENQILFAGFRFIIAGLICLVVLLKSESKYRLPSSESRMPIVVIAIFQTFLQYVFFYIGVAHTSGVKTSILAGTNVFMAMLIASCIFRYEKLSRLKYIGATIGFVGIVIMNIDFETFDWTFQWIGEGFIILTTVCYAFSSGFMKSYSRKFSPLMLVTYQFLLGGVALTGVGYIFGGHFSTMNGAILLLLLYLGAASAAAYTIWSYLLKHYDVSSIAVYGFTTPIFGVLFSAKLLGEYSELMSLRYFVALLCVCIGIVMVNLVSIREKV